MNCKEIITASKMVNTDDEKSVFISSFSDKSDAEIVAVLTVWLTNGLQGEEYALHTLVDEIMQGKPSEYIDNYLPFMNFGDVAAKQCFFRMFTYENLHNLMQSIKDVKVKYGSLQVAFDNTMSKKRNKCKHIHDAFAILFSGNTMFPTRNSNCTFYRYNLLYYLLTHKLGIWSDKYMSYAQIPCNDKIFNKAFEIGVIKKRSQSTLVNVLSLTNAAKIIFGDVEFLRLYDVLNYA